MSQSSKKWILKKASVAQNPTSLRLFCFPPAGSGSWIFLEWSSQLPSSVEVCPVELPGRNSRIGEQPYDSMSALVIATVDAIAPMLADQKPYCLFGHSLGAWIAFEVSREIERRGNLPVPRKLYASANRSPSLGSIANPVDPEETRGVKLADLPEEEFWRHWEIRYGMHQAVASGDPFFSNMFYKLLQADIRIAENYVAQPHDCAPCAVTALRAADETRFPEEHFTGWREHSPAGKHEEKIFSRGGHFYILDEKSPSRLDALKFLAEDLTSLLTV